jgi:hypothetical protein
VDIQTIHECQDSLPSQLSYKPLKNLIMTFSTTVQPVSKPLAEKPVDNSTAASLLSMLVLSVYAAHKSKKAMRKMQRKFLWTAFKLKAASLFSKKRVTDRVLLYILIGVIALVLVFYYPIAALVVAAVALILILTGTI